MRPHDMGVLFEECAERGSRTLVHLDRPFDIAPGVTTYDLPGLAELVRAAAGWLAAAGVRRGERVVILKDNHWDYDLLACAAIRLGAVPALLSGQLPPESVEVLLKRLDPAVLVTTGRHLATGDLPALARRTLTLDHGPAGVLTLDDVRGHPAPAPCRRADDEPLVINHTSGTTGLPKLVTHSTATIIGRLARLESIRWPVLGTRRSDTVASASSFAHGRTFCWTASVLCLAPQRILILSGEQDQALLAAHPPTTLEALPSWFVRHQGLAREPDNPFRRVRLYVSTYDAMHPPTVRAYLHASARKRPLWMQGWGQTETGPLTFRFLTRKALARRDDPEPTTRNLGRPLPGRTRLRVVDPRTFAPLPPGRTGLVLARTRARCLDYVGEPDRFAAKDTDGWWNTGDLGQRTRTGAILFLDREVDQTPELSCVRTEDLLEERLPEVLEAVVLGVRGQPPIPVLVTANGTLSELAWRRAIRDLPAMAGPVPLTWAEVPRTGTGKVRRQELLERLLGRAERHGSGRWT
ncbi:class I adenylate-forming enzyme family protein [Crossiella sp. CA-258035]|uniref:class I adenylate-forming enzyme family protein n=1 Tax=Crossiella sp. CA-258035 TaxID=2981138 RepID=UPI0024BCCAC3|nr:class I adenylate-forming enzyme family protein [Crossiella sp. CA-258035]WHT22862.1 class I adenylate-forming enzyme family protein [Crossiella sp. CA-258035]